MTCGSSGRTASSSTASSTPRLDDAVVTDDEYDQLRRAGGPAGRRPRRRRVHVVDGYRTTHAELVLTPGIQVCFTGAAVDAVGRDLDRDYLEQLATQHGLTPTRSVTAKACDLLVAADPSTQSGKAAKARKFGTPIASVVSFLRSLTTGEPLPVTRLASAGVALVCVDCGNSWLAARQSTQPKCATCKTATTPAPRRQAATASTAGPTIETLTCTQCGNTWERQRVRGRKPLRCPNCT